MFRKVPVYIKILIGMALGIGFGYLAVLNGKAEFISDWVSPWGHIFLKLLKLVAVPLIFFSLVKGISGLTDISRLSKIGIKTLSLYIFSTVVAICLGLLIVNTIKPGNSFPEEKRAELNAQYHQIIEQGHSTAKIKDEQGPLHFFEDLVPENIFMSASDNSSMLQIIFFAILFGIAMISIKNKNIHTVKSFIDGVNEIILRIIDLIMKIAPFGVFALMADLMRQFGNETDGLFIALGSYIAAVLAGLLLLILVFYPGMVYIFGKINPVKFYRGIFSAQLVAFSTSSSAATLPVTMDCAERNLGVKNEVASFVLPIGATINMDGTSLYQAVAAVFIAQAYGIDLDFTQQLTIILTATLASIGSAAVPGAGIVMLVIVLESIGLPTEGIALIIAVDRILDMFRTVVNITGDSSIAAILSNSRKSKTK